MLNGLQVQKLNKLVMEASQELQKRDNGTLGRQKVTEALGKTQRGRIQNNIRNDASGIV